ncbi:MAG: alcohol dehydrogenase catalytic domain-containing protein [Acidobacteriota bacterium]|nr:alcohol dehydrogenase catalytic domain-containing protein [Acidobacteriota bacterium]
MKAAMVRDGRMTVVERDDPRPAVGEAMVRVSVAGICGTDLEIARGYMSFDGIPGHEFVGVVEEAPEPQWVGRRVVGEINASCGSCASCHAGAPRHCPERTVLGILGRDGAFAERLTLPLANLHAVPDEMDDDVAVFTEPLAAAYEILEQVELSKGGRVLVLGAGRLGQLCALVLARAGAPPVVGGRNPKKLARLRKFGLETVDSGGRLPRGFDLVVEATGSPEGLRRALELVRPTGTIVLKSTYHGDTTVALASVVIDEVTIVGSRCGPFEPALAHLGREPSIVDDMITARYALRDVDEAFAHARQPDSLKVLLTV